MQTVKFSIYSKQVCVCVCVIERYQEDLYLAYSELNSMQWNTAVSLVYHPKHEENVYIYLFI